MLVAPPITQEAPVSDQFFDQAAATWDDDPTKVERARIVAERLAAAGALSDATRVLEYGAGTGLVAQALAAHVGPITLAEPSTGMREVAQAKVDAGALPEATRLWDLDLAVTPPPAGEAFDLVVTVQVLHHVADLTPVLAGFHALLAPGGRLVIVDLDREDGSFHAGHGHDHLVHHGFDRADLGALLEASGFRDVAFEHAYDLEKDGRSYPLFLATATRS